LERRDNNCKKIAKEMEINQASSLERKWKRRWRRHKFCINWGNKYNTSFALTKETRITLDSHLERSWQHRNHHNFTVKAWIFVFGEEIAIRLPIHVWKRDGKRPIGPKPLQWGEVLGIWVFLKFKVVFFKTTKH
jgi:hypothetical protein